MLIGDEDGDVRPSTVWMGFWLLFVVVCVVVLLGCVEPVDDWVAVMAADREETIFFFYCDGLWWVFIVLMIVGSYWNYVVGEL